MLAFTDTPISHADFLAAMRAHRDADRLIQGEYWNGWKGCAIGCGIDIVAQATGRNLDCDDHGDHRVLSDLTGIPETLLHVQDIIFEGLTVAEARDWPADFVTAIRPGADLSDVARSFLVRVLREVVVPVAGPGTKNVERVVNIAAEVDADPAYTGQAVFRAGCVVAGQASQIPDDDPTGWTAKGMAARRAVVEAAERAAYTRMAAILLEELARTA